MKIGFCGRAALQKRPDIFVEVSKLVSQKLPGATFVWIGDGELRHLLLEAGITVTGWESEPEKEIEKLDIFVSTATHEALSYSVLEAMALGIPCVLSDVVGNRDLVRHGVNGYLASLERPTEFAKWILEIASNKALRKSFSEKSREFVSKTFTVEAMVDQTHDAYQKVLGASHQKGKKG